jgi:hypothetical protein
MAVNAIDFDLLRRNVYWHELYRNQLPPFTNRAEISQGSVYVASLNPLAPSITSFGTNASNIIRGPEYLSSADLLELYSREGVSTLSFLSDDDISITDDINLIETIEEPVDQPVQASDIVDLTEIPGEIQTVTPGVEVAETTFQPVIITDTEESQEATITGPMAQTTEAQEYAAVTSGYGVNLSDDALKALQEIQNMQANAYLNQLNPFKTMDGMIPIAAATLSDFSGPYNFNNNRPFEQGLKNVQPVEDLNQKRRYGEIPSGGIFAMPETLEANIFSSLTKKPA